MTGFLHESLQEVKHCPEGRFSNSCECPDRDTQPATHQTSDAAENIHCLNAKKKKKRDEAKQNILRIQIVTSRAYNCNRTKSRRFSHGLLVAIERPQL
ncbi:hypothetical protein NPIL_250891 [Nephila pilipes]|uniref:Uncharacterized protein n=1 Tax=Nephila pilipes TaxID=299642 RepID=A0A8X6PCX3_NEPPI|nr:hypothetical protein NPIL_250891 [Nephila pilipes]